MRWSTRSESRSLKRSHGKLFLGFAADGLPLEVIVVENSGQYAVIHSMRMRTIYRQMLNEGE